MKTPNRTIFINEILFQFFEKDDFKVDEAFIIEIKELIKPYYEDSQYLLEREVNRNKSIYFLRDELNQLACFFMANQETLGGRLTFYMGLTAIRDCYKNLYLSEPLMAWHMKKVSELEKELNKKILCWCHTAIITSYRVIERYFEHLTPNRDGNNFDESSIGIAKMIVEKFGYKYDESNPFILRGVASGTRASMKERKRIEFVTKKHNFTLFRKLNIEEYDGDRIILLSYVPNHKTIETFYGKFFAY